jgi:hypothetical protein
MEKKKSVTVRQRELCARNLRLVISGLAATGRPALIVIGVLMVIWCVARLMEALHGNVIFDMSLTYWFGLAVWILLALWAVGLAIVSMEDYRKLQNRKAAGISWIFFLILAVMVLLSLEGFRVASAGLFAALAGSPETSKQASFLLIKFHYANPMLAMNLATLKFMGAAWDIKSLAPYVWSWNMLFAFFIWSCSYGIVLLMKKDHIGSKCLHIFLSAFGLAALIILKSVSMPTIEQMIMFQAAVLILLVFQVLLAYASIRSSAVRAQQEATSLETVEFSAHEHENATENRLIGGLPPSAIKLALFIFFILPILTDLQKQFNLSSASARVINEISMNQMQAPPQFVTISPISIRSGPAAGDEILGVLPKGTRIPVQDIKFKWVNIGQNKWVPEKFLRPLGQENITIQ